MQIIDNHSTSYDIIDPDNNEVKNTISANYLKSIVNGKEIELPYLAATKQDYKKSDSANIPDASLSSRLFQYYINMEYYGDVDITNADLQVTITKNFNSIIESKKPLISDINFWWDGTVWTPEQRTAALNLQLTLGTDFLSDVVIDKNNITINDFKNQLDSLLHDFDTDKPKCPTISMGTPIDIFIAQLELISKKKFKRFNVEWGGITNYLPWVELSEFLNDKPIWCNLTSINRKRQGHSMRSNAMIGFVHGGAHSCSNGYPFFYNDDTFEPKSHLLNKNTCCYEPDPNSPYEISDTVSHNRLWERVLDLQLVIKNEIYHRS